jgi:hyperosmotically inducible protein
MNKPTIAAVLALSILAGSQVIAQSAAPVAPDNAKSNRVDASNAATAESQSNKTADLDITRRIRQGVLADKSLSTYAHNVKIITVNGSVTLNGVVRTTDEKTAVEMKAADVAGKANVTNDLKVAPSK